MAPSRPPINFNVQRYPWGVTGEYLNDDNLPDLVVGNVTEGTISVLLNDTPVTQPNPRSA